MIKFLQFWPLDFIFFSLTFGLFFLLKIFKKILHTKHQSQKLKFLINYWVQWQLNFKMLYLKRECYVIWIALICLCFHYISLLCHCVIRFWLGKFSGTELPRRFKEEAFQKKKKKTLNKTKKLNYYPKIEFNYLKLIIFIFAFFFSGFSKKKKRQKDFERAK